MKQFFNPIAVAVNSSVDIEAHGLAGFYAATAGTLTITAKNSGRVVVDVAPVIAGWNVMPFALARSNEAEFTFTTAGGASGWIAI